MTRQLCLVALSAALALLACDKGDARKPTQPAAPTTPTTPPVEVVAATPEPEPTPEPVPVAAPAAPDGFQWQTEQFGDTRILRYRVDGFEALPLNVKQLLYYLYEASLSGRDIIWDQSHAYGLRIRKTLEAVVKSYSGDRDRDDFKAFLTYAKRVWFGNGVFHQRSNLKFEPGFPRPQFAAFVKASDSALLPLAEGQTVDALIALLEPVIFDEDVDAIKVSKDSAGDMVVASATNFYGPGLTQAEVEAFYAKRALPKDPKPVMHGLNSQLVKRADGTIVERVWKIGGMYGPAIEKMVFWLEKAVAVAENEAQKTALKRLVAYYKSGDLKDFDAFNIAWVKDTQSHVDMIHGFIETYGDPMDMRGGYEAILSVVDPVASERIRAISREAQWFEDQSPIDAAFKKAEVTGISARVINVVVGSGEAQPSFPIGVNLPNSDWIRADHGSKSVTLGNIVESYEEASKSNGLLEAFAFTPEEVARSKAHGGLADKLHTDLHEVIGHASGKLGEGVAPASETLKNYAGTLEEARADLIAMYFLMDPKLVELGVMESLEVGRASYDDYFRSGILVQLSRVKPGKSLQDTHLRNRQLNAAWVLKHGEGAVEQLTKDGKTYVVVRDYAKARVAFGKLLAEVQRIKSTGDYAAGKALVEGYGVKVDPTLHAEVLERYGKLGIAPYGGFINPKLQPVTNDAGEITDVTISYPDDYTAQMLEYGAKYALLPAVN